MARVRDLPCFDLGAVTATSNRDRPVLSSYDFKREFGGYLEPVPPSHCATRPDVLLEAWTVDDVAAEISSLVPPMEQASFFAIALAQEARRKALAFTRTLHTTLGPKVPRPSVGSEANGGITMRWLPAMTGSGRLVELVFFRDAIEYAVLDGSDASAGERWLLRAGQASDIGEVLREVVTRYVVRAEARASVTG